MAETKAGAPWKVLLVDDEQSALQMYGALLREDGIPVLTAATGERARALAKSEPRLGLVVLDLVLPDVEGLGLFRAIRAARPEVPVVMLTAFGSVDTAVQALREGAYHFLTKPADLEQWRALVRSALEKRSLEEENRTLRERLGEAGAGELIGRSRPMEELRAHLAVVGDSQAAVLVQGESGTGKELAARAIHRASSRREGPFVSLNCGALPAQLLESELFGYEKGAFTGAAGAKPGQFELAHGGTIFLDEIGECSPELQVRLLRVLQEKEVQRLGGTRRVATDFRLVAATNRNLAEEIKAGRFREDLFYRINVIEVTHAAAARAARGHPAAGGVLPRAVRPAREARPSRGFPGRPWSAWARTTGRGTCASWKTRSSAGSWWAAGRCSRPRTCRRRCVRPPRPRGRSPTWRGGTCRWPRSRRR